MGYIDGVVSMVSISSMVKVMRIVFKDTGFADDQTKINVRQIFKAMSPDTEVKAI